MSLLKLLRLAKDMAEPATVSYRPPEEQCAATQKKRCGPALQNFYSFGSLENDQHLNRPENCKCECHAAGDVGPAWPRCLHESIERQRPDPRLDAEPATGNDGAQNRCDVGATDAEAGSAQH